MTQRYLNLPNFRTARDYLYLEHIRRGTELAAAHGLVASYVNSTWERKTDDWYGIHLVAYIPRDATAGLFGISRSFDGVYASVTCSTQEQASAALAATTREVFERAGDGVAPRPGSAAVLHDDQAMADAVMLEADASERVADLHLQGEQLSLL